VNYNAKERRKDLPGSGAAGGEDDDWPVLLLSVSAFRLLLWFLLSLFFFLPARAISVFVLFVSVYLCSCVLVLWFSSFLFSVLYGFLVCPCFCSFLFFWSFVLGLLGSVLCFFFFVFRLCFYCDLFSWNALFLVQLLLKMETWSCY